MNLTIFIISSEIYFESINDKGNKKYSVFLKLKEKRMKAHCSLRSNLKMYIGIISCIKMFNFGYVQCMCVYFIIIYLHFIHTYIKELLKLEIEFS